MTESLSLQVKTRTQSGSKNAQELRSEKRIPAVLYGHGLESISVEVPEQKMHNVYTAAGESTLIDLTVDEKEPVKVVIHDVQRDALNHTISHVDFYQVKMDEKMHAEIELVFEGAAPAVKNLGGTLVKNIDHIQIECLPKDLVHHITVDISTLATFDDVIRVKDLSVPSGVTLLQDDEDGIASVAAPRTEEELKALEEDVVENVESVEVDGAKEAEEGGEEKDAPAESAK